MNGNGQKNTHSFSTATILNNQKTEQLRQKAKNDGEQTAIDCLNATQSATVATRQIGTLFSSGRIRS